MPRLAEATRRGIAEMLSVMGSATIAAREVGGPRNPVRHVTTPNPLDMTLQAADAVDRAQRQPVTCIPSQTALCLSAGLSGELQSTQPSAPAPGACSTSLVQTTGVPRHSQAAACRAIVGRGRQAACRSGTCVDGEAGHVCERGCGRQYARKGCIRLGRFPTDVDVPLCILGRLEKEINRQLFGDNYQECRNRSQRRI